MDIMTEEPTAIGSIVDRAGRLSYVLMRTDRGKYWVALDADAAYDMGAAQRIKPGFVTPDIGPWWVIFDNKRNGDTS